LVRGLSLHLRSIVHWTILIVFRELTDMVSRVVTHSSLLVILPLKLLPLAIILLPDLLDFLLQLSIQGLEIPRIIICCRSHKTTFFLHCILLDILLLE
jgi:hypothetical protein